MNEAEKTAILKRVDEALNTMRPHLKVDGGDVEVVDISPDMEVSIKWLGNCEFCSMSVMTMKAGIEQAIKEKVPEIKSVIASNGVQSI